LATHSQACLFVGEDEMECGFAIDAHPLLVNEVLDGHRSGS
jgi:hypothetical protein